MWTTSAQQDLQRPYSASLRTRTTATLRSASGRTRKGGNGSGIPGTHQSAQWRCNPHHPRRKAQASRDLRSGYLRAWQEWGSVHSIEPSGDHSPVRRRSKTLSQRSRIRDLPEFGSQRYTICCEGSSETHVAAKAVWHESCEDTCSIPANSPHGWQGGNMWSAKCDWRMEHRVVFRLRLGRVPRELKEHRLSCGSSLWSCGCLHNPDATRTASY